MGSPVERYVADRLRTRTAATVVFLNADARAAVSAAVQLQSTERVYACHRRLSVVQALQRDTSVLTGAATTLLHAHGRRGMPDDLRADVVVIRLPQEKLALLQLLHDATHLLREGGECLVFGGTDEGVKSAGRIMEQCFGAVSVLAHSGGHRLLRAARTASADVEALECIVAPYHDPDAFRGHVSVLRGEAVHWYARPGVFSWDHLDEATEALASHLRIEPGATVLDLGCGAGILGAVAGRLANGGAVTLLDADSEAVRCAEQTMAVSGVAEWRVLPSDVGSAVHADRFDVVVCNPPFHVGKATDLGLPVRFIEDAWAVLNAGGSLQLVANRTLPYENELQRVFGNRRTVHDGARFKVLEALKR